MHPTPKAVFNGSRSDVMDVCHAPVVFKLMVDITANADRDHDIETLVVRIPFTRSIQLSVNTRYTQLMMTM